MAKGVVDLGGELPEGQQATEEYRQGYHAGFMQGVETLVSLARSDERRALVGELLAAFGQCYDFWQGALAEWRGAGQDGRAAPEMRRVK